MGVAAMEVNRVWSGGVRETTASRRMLANSSMASSGASMRSVMARPSVPVDVSGLNWSRH